MKKKILITGSNGLLGQKLVKLLRDKNDFQFVATSRGENRISELYPDMQYCSMDICNPDSVSEVLSKEKPDFVINTAAMTQVDECEENKELCYDLNVNSVQYLIDNCRKINAHLIHLSTDFIFDGENGPYKETDTANPLSYYGETKLKAEELILASGIKYSIVRTVLVYGIVHEMSRSNIILWVKNSLENQNQIKVVNDQWRSPTLAEDLAMGCYLICQKEATGIYNISGPDFLTPYDMAIATAEFFNLDKSLIEEVDGTVFTQKAKRPPKTGFILDKSKKDLDFDPHSFRDGIKILASQVKN